MCLSDYQLLNIAWVFETIKNWNRVHRVNGRKLHSKFKDFKSRRVKNYLIRHRTNFRVDEHFLIFNTGEILVLSTSNSIFVPVWNIPWTFTEMQSFTRSRSCAPTIIFRFLITESILFCTKYYFNFNLKKNRIFILRHLKANFSSA